jgi:hypothetical protein
MSEKTSGIWLAVGRRDGKNHKMYMEEAWHNPAAQQSNTEAQTGMVSTLKDEQAMTANRS